VNASSARGVAAGGAILVAFSLVTPWFVLEAQGLSGQGKAGIAALGPMALFVVILAVMAGWSGTRRLHTLLPVAASGALALIVLARLVWPPSALGALGGFGSDQLGSVLARPLAQALARGIGLHYAPAWGLWLAVIGVAASLAGTILTLTAGEARASRGPRLSVAQEDSEPRTYGF
jgi:hypothetical protein